mmetsp:Transcript_10667/g.26257  ORF Transcript_10667/g.26257 Transcript_10667/m.26257 type:complete len:227 (-) Transcript_10667:1576-2256(-)
MLIAPLQVNVRGKIQSHLLRGAFLQHSRPRRAGIEPNVHGIRALDPLIGLRPVLFGQEVDLVHFPPGVAAVFGEDGLHVVQSVLVEQDLGPARLLVVKDRDGDSPGTLTGDAPVSAGFDEGVDAVFAHFRDPLNRIDRLQRILPKSLHAREPLIRGPEYRRLLRPPIVRVLVTVILRPNERPGLLQRLHDPNVAIPQHAQTNEVVPHDRGRAGLDGESANVVHGTE